MGETAAYLSQRDRLDDTLLAIVSDHGLSATHTHFDPVPFLEERGYYPLFYPKTYRRRPDTACMVSGNAMAHLYFPRTSEDLHAAGDDLIKLFASCKAISFVASRDRRGVVRVSGEAGEAHIRRQGNCIEYRVQGQDPLGYGDLPEKLSLRESLEHTFNAEFPDGPVQLLQLFQSPRCGDLVLNADIGFDLRARYEHPEHHGSHGSLHRQHMQVPLLLNHPLEHNRPLRTVDLFPSILRLTGRSVPADLDGKSFV